VSEENEGLFPESDDEVCGGEGFPATPEDDAALEEATDFAAKAEEYYDQLLRLRAEFENFRKRMARERLEQARFAAEEIMVAVLPVLDNLERALEAAMADVETDSLLVGVEMTRTQLLDALSRFGLVRMQVVGVPFDPNLHEAVDYAPSDEHPDGVILEELQHGYMLNGKVVRPALVRVSSGPNAR